MRGQSLSRSRSDCFLLLFTGCILLLIATLWDQSNNCGVARGLSLLINLRSLVDAANLRDLAVFQRLLVPVYHIEFIFGWISLDWCICPLAILGLPKRTLLMLLARASHGISFRIPEVLSHDILKCWLLLFITVLLLLCCLWILLGIGWS